MKRGKWKCLAAVLAAAVLAFGGCGKEETAQTETETRTVEMTEAETETETEEGTEEETEESTAEEKTETETAEAESSAQAEAETVAPSTTAAPATETPTTAAPATAAPATAAPTTAPAATQAPARPQVTGGHLVAIDAGHQAHGWSEQEPIGPGSSVTKPKTSTGTQGCVTGIHESQLNLNVSLKLRDALRARGYQVYMVRESQDVQLSNKDRADMANASGAEIFLRVHANSSADPSMRGVLTMAPSAGNPFIPQLSASSTSLSSSVVNHISAATGLRNIGVLAVDDMSGINWSKIPVTIIEMGYMSNPEEDTLLNTPSFQDQIVQGICNGVDEYFASH